MKIRILRKVCKIGNVKNVSLELDEKFLYNFRNLKVKLQGEI